MDICVSDIAREYHALTKLIGIDRQNLSHTTLGSLRKICVQRIIRMDSRRKELVNLYNVLESSR